MKKFATFDKGSRRSRQVLYAAIYYDKKRERAAKLKAAEQTPSEKLLELIGNDTKSLFIGFPSK